jgi:hypothetical protein
VRIALTDGQVARVVQEASGGAGLAGLLSGVSDLERLHSVVLPLLDDPRCSRSTFRALLVLGAFPADGSERELTDIAKRLGFSPSTTHRYIGTWLAVGLLEQDPHSRRYRRALATTQAASAIAMAGGRRDGGGGGEQG